MSLPIRNSVKVLLLNDKNELLLMCADDPKVTSSDGKYHGRFWFAIGGEIENNETFKEAAVREIYEETGIKKEELEFGPIVWFGEFDLILKGVLTHLKQTFIVAKTKQHNAFLKNPTDWEKQAVKKVEWFSLEKIKNCPDVIYPVLLSRYLPDILSGKYPKCPIEIDLGKKPNKK